MFKKKPKPIQRKKNIIQEYVEAILFAFVVAMVVRNTMEDFHCQHLSDEQMQEPNPIIRNAIGTALHAFQHREDAEADQMFVAFHTRSIPKYWEEPVLTKDSLAVWERLTESHVSP